MSVERIDTVFLMDDGSAYFYDRPIAKLWRLAGSKRIEITDPQHFAHICSTGQVISRAGAMKIAGRARD